MFYSDSILTKKGPLANIWLAAHWDRKLTKAQIVQTNINESVNDIMSGHLQTMALRLSGQLLLGVSKIYDRKAKYLLEDCSDAAFRIKTVFKPGAQVDLPAEQSKASVAAITLSTTMNVNDLMMPELDLNLDEILREAAAAQTSGNKATTLISKPDLKQALAAVGTEGSGHVGFGPIQDINEIPGDIDMLDIELGRRATDGRPSEPLSIEQGRRESMKLGSDQFDVMQFSPLRTPTKEGFTKDFDNFIPMDDDYGAMPFDQNAEDMNPENFPGSDPIVPQEMSPIAEKIEAIPRAVRQRKAKKGTLVLDEITDITSNELQAYIRNNEEICDELVFKQDAVDEFNMSRSVFDLPSFASSLNTGLFAPLFAQKIKEPVSKTSRTKIVKEEEEPIEKDFDNVPMMDDDYGFMAPDHIEKLPYSDQFDAENFKPEENVITENIAALQSPMKRLSLGATQQATAAFSRDTLDTLDIWRTEFTAAKGKTLSLESDLMVAMAGTAPITKKVAASAFFEALVLSGKGLVKVRQQAPFSPITVQAKPAIFAAIGASE